MGNQRAALPAASAPEREAATSAAANNQLLALARDVTGDFAGIKIPKWKPGGDTGATNPWGLWIRR